MKKSVFTQIVNLVNGLPVEDMEALRDAINAEAQALADKAATKANEYDTAKPIVLDTLAQASAPVSIREIYEACRDTLPEGFTQGKVQYALREVWADAVVKHTEGKVNTYTLA